MSAINSRLGAVAYATEASWAVATDTWGTRLQTSSPVDLSGFGWEKLPVNPTQQYPHEDVEHVQGVKTGQFTIELPLAGHGGSATGALTATDLYTLLVNVIGAGYASQVVDSFTGGTAAAPTVDVAGTWAPNTLIRAGVLADGRGEGQWGAIASESGGTLTMLTALAGAPNNGDDAYGALLVYPPEDALESVTSTRWLIMSGNRQIKARGCFPTAVRIRDTAANRYPMVAITFQASWWDDATETFPSATATDAKAPIMVGNGSLFINDRGTSTRSVHDWRSCEIQIDLDVRALTGPGAVNANQTIVGARRVGCGMMLTFEFDSEANGTTTWKDKWTSGTAQHILLGLSTDVAIYVPNALLTGVVPTQRAVNGLNRERVSFKATANTAVTTNGRTLAPWQLGLSSAA